VQQRTVRVYTNTEHSSIQLKLRHACLQHETAFTGLAVTKGLLHCFKAFRSAKLRTSTHSSTKLQLRHPNLQQKVSEMKDMKTSENRSVLMQQQTVHVKSRKSTNAEQHPAAAQEASLQQEQYTQAARALAA
jgi:hypothetical protein